MIKYFIKFKNKLFLLNNFFFHLYNIYKLKKKKNFLIIIKKKKKKKKKK
jgi:hypothetical protein